MEKFRRRRICRENPKTLTTESNHVVSQFSLLDLPVAVSHEILFKLPLACIMNVKLVCKALYKLVSSPEFFIHYSKNSPFATLFFADSRKMSLVLLEISENSGVIETRFNPKIPSWSEEDSDSFLVLKDTCNGFLCLSAVQYTTEKTYICNPIIGEFIELPKHRIRRNGEFSLEYGLGFCRSTNNYKVLRFQSGKVPDKGQAEIFTIGVDDRWRVLPTIFNATPVTGAQFITLNGFFHWLVMHNNTTWIFTFDIEEEKFGQISPPDGVVLRKNKMNLILIHDQLCLVDKSDISAIIIWKMKEYGVVDSWTKDVIFNIPFPSLHPMIGPVTISKKWRYNYLLSIWEPYHFV